MTTTVNSTNFNLTTIAAKIQTIIKEMNERIIERGDVINAFWLTTVAGTNMIMLGPPGTAKSYTAIQAVKAFADDVKYFGVQASPFTTPEEFFGPFDMDKVMQGDFVRKTDGYLPTSNIAFVDELGKGNGGSLNAMLTLMSDRLFYNGGKAVEVPLYAFLAASNEIPNAPGQEALWDRCVVRMVVDNLSLSGLVKMKQVQQAHVASRPYSQMVTMAEIEWLHAKLADVVIPDSVNDKTAKLVHDLRGDGVFITDRKSGLGDELMKANALLDGRMTVSDDDVDVLQNVFWDTPDARKVVRKAVAAVGNPLKSRQVELLDEASEVHGNLMAMVSKSDKDTLQQAAMEANSKLDKIRTELNQMAAKNPGSPFLSKLVDAAEQVTLWKKDVVTNGLGVSM